MEFKLGKINYQLVNEKIRIKLNWSLWLSILSFVFLFSLIFLVTDWNTRKEVIISISEIIAWLLIIYVFNFGRALSYPLFWEINFDEREGINASDCMIDNAWKVLFPVRYSITKKEMDKLVINQKISRKKGVTSNELLLELLYDNNKVLTLLRASENQIEFDILEAIGKQIASKYKLELILENETTKFVNSKPISPA